jgi:hypothetical protein
VASEDHDFLSEGNWFKRIHYLASSNTFLVIIPHTNNPDRYHGDHGGYNRSQQEEYQSIVQAPFSKRL